MLSVKICRCERLLGDEKVMISDMDVCLKKRDCITTVQCEIRGAIDSQDLPSFVHLNGEKKNLTSLCS